MPSKFDETVQRVAARIRDGRVVLTERVRSGKRRAISVGPYRSAVGPRQYALCVLPALPGQDDCSTTQGPDRTARKFVRLVGVDNAQDALVREARKRGG
jgi:hypothetical protein